MHMPYSYGSAGIPSSGDVGACKRAHITIQDLLIFMKIKINRVHLESYRMHLTGLISS